MSETPEVWLKDYQPGKLKDKRVAMFSGTVCRPWRQFDYQNPYSNAAGNGEHTDVNGFTGQSRLVATSVQPGHSQKLYFHEAY